MDSYNWSDVTHPDFIQWFLKLLMFFVKLTPQTGSSRRQKLGPKFDFQLMSGNSRSRHPTDSRGNETYPPGFHEMNQESKERKTSLFGKREVSVKTTKQLLYDQLNIGQ